MFNKEITSVHSLAIWLIAAVLLINTILLVASGVMFVRLERAQLRLESQLCGTIELQRGWSELREAQSELRER